MRHLNRGRKLGRNASHRKAMERNMACSLILAAEASNSGGRVVTTVAKAKELRPAVEKLVTVAKNAVAETTQVDGKLVVSPRGVALRRRLFAELRSRDAVDRLLSVIAVRSASRPGGYLRLIPLASRRLGDAGRQMIIEWVD